MLTKIYITFLIVVAIILRIVTRWSLAIFFSGRKHIVPPVKDKLLLKSAVALASDIRKRKIKSEDVIKSYVARIKEVNPYLNAVCEERFDAALNEARKVDKIVASGAKSYQQLKNEKPLFGVPFTVKILIGVKGFHCNGASLVHMDVKAYEDAEVVSLMKKAGAICLATTNSPEFGLNFETYNNIYGRTSNPYDTTRTSGGSSGGEGALVGSGASVIGIGNDIAGSIRHPCNFNGIFGHKPTVGLISNEGMFPVLTQEMNKFLSTGPMCRYVEDLILATKLLSGAKGAKMKFDQSVDFSKMKLYYMLDDENPVAQRVSQDIKDSIMKAVLYFQSTYNMEIKKINIKQMRKAFMIYFSMVMNSLGEKKLEDVLSGGKGTIKPTNELLKSLFGQSKITIGPLGVMNYKKFPFIYRDKNSSRLHNCFQQLQRELETILDENSVLFLPSFSSKAHHHYDFPSRILSISYMCVFNTLGNPVTQCPVGLSNDKLPLGFQVVGAKWQDHLTLAFAAEIEKVFKGWVPPNNHSLEKSRA